MENNYENNHAEDFEPIELLEEYLAAHFKGDEFDEEFHGEKLFPGDDSRKVEKYFGIELYKILSECIDEFIDKVIKGDYSNAEGSENPDEEHFDNVKYFNDFLNQWSCYFEKSERDDPNKKNYWTTYSDYLKWMLDKSVLEYAGYSSYTEQFDEKNIDVVEVYRDYLQTCLCNYVRNFMGYDPDESYPNDEDQESLSFREIINLRSPIYIPIFKAHFWFHKILDEVHYWHGAFPNVRYSQLKDFWVGNNFHLEDFFWLAPERGSKTSNSLLHHNYAELREAIKAYLEERKQAATKFKDSLSGKPQQNESEKVEPTFADILRTIIGIYQKVYPTVYHKDSVIYKRADLSRQDFSRILNGSLKPSRENVIKFIRGLHPIDVLTAEILLNAAGFPMTNAIKDAIVAKNKVLEEKPTSKFSETFMGFFDELNASDKKYYASSAVYNRAESDRQTFFKIKNNIGSKPKDKDKTPTPYQPNKDTAASYAIALELGLNDANKLLTSADFFLSNLIKRDVIISYFLEDPISRLRNNDDLSHVALVNKWLERYACPILTGRKPFYSTEVVFVLCNSNSMRGREKFIIKGFDSLIVNQAEIGNAPMGVSTIFTNDKFKLGYYDKKLTCFVEYNNNNQLKLGKNKSLNYSVNDDSAALLDAICYAIDKIKSRHDKDSEAAPLKTVFIILSDGAKDTDSKFCTCDTIKKLIKAQIKSGWDFLFFAETDAENFAKSIGIKESCAVDYQPDAAGIEKIFNAMGKFIEAVRTLPLEKHPTNSWRKELQA